MFDPFLTGDELDKKTVDSINIKEYIDIINECLKEKDISNLLSLAKKIDDLNSKYRIYNKKTKDYLLSKIGLDLVCEYRNHAIEVNGGKELFRYKVINNKIEKIAYKK